MTRRFADAMGRWMRGFGVSAIAAFALTLVAGSCKSTVAKRMGSAGTADAGAVSGKAMAGRTGDGEPGGAMAGGSGGDAGGGCPAGLAGPALVEVPAPAGSTVSRYCIDATEVTNAQYKAFLDTTPAVSGQPAECAPNTTYVPTSLCMWPATGKDDYPVGCVDWCDAYAYCAWAGKHLCGKIGGAANAFGDYADATKSEWYNACSTAGTKAYPYGDTYMGTACNGSDRGSGATLPVGSEPMCEGGYPGVFDLSGNVWEWENSCNATTGSGDACHVRGGSYGLDMSALACADGQMNGRGRTSGAGGFRCCL